MRSGRHAQIRFWHWLLVLTACLSVCTAANAQSASAATGSSKPQLTSTVTTLRGSPEGFGDSIISADDVLEIYVMDVAELSRQYRVSPTANVALPLLPKPVAAAGMTPSQFSESLAQQLHDGGLVTNPHIMVT